MHNFINSIKNLFHWFKTIWNDKHWAPDFTYLILKKKLELQHDFLKKNSMSASADEECACIQKCINLLNRILDEATEDESRKAFEDKWNGSLDMTIQPDGFVKFFVTNVSEDKQEEAMEDWHKFYILGEEERKAEIKQLFTILTENIERWWD